jgi:hypothetical protein
MDTLFPGAQILNMNPYRDPCTNNGLYLARLVYNGTSILICSDKFASLKAEEQEQSNLALGLGLGLGLGIPFLLIIGIWAWSRCRPCASDRGSFGWPSARVPPAQPDLHFPREEVERVLTPAALDDFRFGNMTEGLKKEIMVHRLIARRDLREFVRYAEQCRQPELATWIDRLNTGAFPPEVQAAAREKILARAAEYA